MKKTRVILVAVALMATVGVFAKVSNHAKVRATTPYITKNGGITWILISDALSTTSAGSQATISGQAGTFSIYNSTGTSTPLYLPN